MPFRTISIRRTGLRTTCVRAWQRLQALFDLIIGIGSIPEFYLTSLSLHVADLPFQSAQVTIRFGGFQEFEDVVQA
jgi:hypothetical protein